MLTRLAASGLLRVEAVGNQKFYQATSARRCTRGAGRPGAGLVGLATGPLRAALAPLADRITAAFVYGSVARAASCGGDIDLMVIADDLDLRRSPPRWLQRRGSGADGQREPDVACTVAAQAGGPTASRRASRRKRALFVTRNRR